MRILLNLAGRLFDSFRGGTLYGKVEKLQASPGL
ncbi:hypothetical protein HBHAL_4305 [Halobacillus halophilus DSM 2266]|uniref:Uncharacterized protein n=1 Tax=Halobacillus halophilus (strain ATCC 35676 / DSM 2266 / JCM 20832 / KCTC 3685 / LMG 17431 / NBRC 102448 / NCIMB 2269) TaxID=866895 RepID=I0JR76_HALH3|nr:hypothetical protein HBHAL_4305 [Halobacillus halophilus DSM 2266]